MIFQLHEKRHTTLLSPFILIASNIFLFIPFLIYESNSSEFVTPFGHILLYFSVPFVGFLIVVTVFGFFLNRKFYQRYISISFMLGVLVWCQGSVLVWNYGALNGQGINWTTGAWRGWVDGTLWISCLVLSQVFCRQVYKVAGLASRYLLVLQLAFLALMSFQNTAIWDKAIVPPTPPKEIYEFSSTENVIHIVLDGFQSDIFHNILDENPNYYSILQGVTFFREATSTVPSTRLSIPAMLSGQTYKNDIPMPDFIKMTATGKNIPSTLSDIGYEVDAVPISTEYINLQHSDNVFVVPMLTYGKTRYERDKSNLALMLDLVLFRSSPHFLKNLVYNDQGWLIQRFLDVESYAQSMYLSHSSFLQDFIENMSVKRNKPVYKFIHLTITHGPPILNERCEDTGEVLPTNREEMKVHDKCALDHLMEFIAKLKSLNIYDSSLIILNADHGRNIKVSEMQNRDKLLTGDIGLDNNTFDRIVSLGLPFLAVKPPHEKGPLRISNAQVQLTDIPDTVASILNLNVGFGGRSVYEVGQDEVRERRYYYYQFEDQNWGGKFLTNMTEFIIKGSVFDKSSWELGKTYLPSVVSYQTTEINFSSSESSRFLRFGWSDIEKNATARWALGQSASLLLSVPKDKTIFLTANMKSLSFDTPQYVTVVLDGKEIGIWKLSAPWYFEKHSVVIQPDNQRNPFSVLEFRFAQHRKPGMDPRSLSALFKSLTLSEMEPYKWGTTINFGKSESVQLYQREGWSEPESISTWSNGKRASLELPITQSSSESIELNVNSAPFIVPGEVTQQTVNILVNGKKAGKWVFTKPGVQLKSVVIPRDLFAGANILRITFELPDATSPLQIGQSGDKRMLAINVRDIRLTK